MSLSCKEILDKIKNQDQDFINKVHSYYSDDFDINPKLKRLEKILNQEILESEQEVIVSRCPGRISLSKHADYINSDLLYVLDDRDLYFAIQKINSPEHKAYRSIFLKNLDKDFPEIHINYQELQNKNFNKLDWSFYIFKLIEELNLIEKLQDCGLVIIIDSEIPVGSGLSSSHALLLSAFSALVNLFGLESYQKTLDSRNSNLDKAGVFEIIKLCQKVENAKGFNSGLGDQSVQLLGKKNHFCFIKIFPKLEVECHKIPTDLAIMSAPSFIKAEKSLPEFKAANENISNYKKINELVKPLGHNYLADLIYNANDNDIYKFLDSICDHNLKGLALYGLAEAKRLCQLKKSFNPETLGKHLNLSHLAELNFHYEPKTKSCKAFDEEEKLKFDYDPNKDLGEHSGLYRASTKENDELYYLTKELEDVYGTSISGAGLGGSNTIVCRKSTVSNIISCLIENFYKPRNLQEKALKYLHLTYSSEAVSVIIN